ncbi:MAG: ABC transporter permease [Deltaproteobacteria bacterium]|nr:ABC transporter permease [Deltaproteobacteria bacterium]
MNLIHIHNLKKIYKPEVKNGEQAIEVQALQGVNLTISQGEYVSIMGPSGSGKSTLMQILGLLDRPTSGEYLFLGKDVSKLSGEELAYLRSRYVGFVFQFFNLLARTSALENVELPLIYSHVPQSKTKAQKVLTQVGLQDRLHHAPHQLSGGQQQRVAIARALVNNPKIIFADEPTGNVNQEQAKEIMKTLSILHAQGVTIVLVTHDPQVASHAERTIKIVDGKIFSDESKKITPRVHEELKPPQIKKFGLMNSAEMKENFKMAVGSLKLNKLRTGLTMLGIIIGVAAVITMVALGQGAQKSIEESLKSLGSNLLMIRPGSPKLGHVRRESGDSTRITLEDAKAIKSLKEVGLPIDDISTEVTGQVQVVYGNKNWNTRLQGVSANYAELHASNPTIGRFFSEAENETKKRVCVLGKTVYENLFENGQNPVGSIIKINRVNFKVLGILPAKGGSAWGDRDDVIVTPVTTAMQRILGKDYLNSMDVQVTDAESMDRAIAGISELLRKKHRLSQGQEDDFSIRNMAEIQEALSSTTKIMALLLGAIAAISLFVGGIGIMNIMLVSVKERTKEIGLRKALGARQSDVLLQFLIEAIMIGLVGGAIGIFMGGISSFSINIIFGWATHISISAVIISFLFSFAIGVIFGFWPARQASLLSPIEALRYE